MKNPLIWGLISFPLMLAAVFFVTYPFADNLDSKTFSISILSPIQKSNIEIAAKAVNGTILKPGEKFSFNRIVGPRTDIRGYRPAPSYLGPESPSTIGGGICLLSSALYQLALESGLQIDNRVPHLRTIKTVPPGLDATVWYGQADLTFENTLPFPVQIATDWNHTTLTVSILGKKPHGYHPAHLQRIVDRSTPSEMVVELLREQGNRTELVSRDHYSIAN
ncbi:MAG TPA: VanW family protein [Candidatus Obscuribacterales bacterium]